MEDFYAVYSRNMAQLGTPVHSRTFFQELSRRLGDQFDVLIVRKDEIPVAAMVLVKFKQTLADPWASSLRQYGSYAPNMLLYWEALKFGCTNGFEVFDFGRSEVGSGTYQFKKQWGACPFAFERIRYAEDSVQPMSNQGYRGGLASAFQRIWKSLPYPVTLWLGPRVRPFLP